MDSPSLPDRSIGSRKHIRNVSSQSRTPLARRSTKGPLDDADDSPAPNSLQYEAAVDPLQATALNTPIPSTPFSPERGYSIPLSATTAAAPPPLAATPPPPSNQRAAKPAGKDLSFLLRPSIYHALPTLLQTPSQQPKLPPVALTTASLQNLLKKHNYRHAAMHCANRLTQPPAPSQDETFHLFYTRLACLVLLNFIALAAEESTLLEDTSSSFYRDGDGKNVLPWELRMICARLASMAHSNDVRRGIAAFYELGREARVQVKKAKGLEKEAWRQKLKECGMGVANILVECGDYEGATRHLENLRCSEAKGQDEVSQLDVQLAVTYLSLGDVDAAHRCCGDPANGIMKPLILIAEGKYVEAAAILREMAPSDLVRQNLAVCLFYTGQKDESIQLLEALVDKGRTHQILTFNLATCYELTSERAPLRKRQLAERVTDGLRDRGDEGERNATAFKL